MDNDPFRFLHLNIMFLSWTEFGAMICTQSTHHIFHWTFWKTKEKKQNIGCCCPQQFCGLYGKRNRRAFDRVEGILYTFAEQPFIPYFFLKIFPFYKVFYFLIHFMFFFFEIGNFVYSSKVSTKLYWSVFTTCTSNPTIFY